MMYKPAYQLGWHNNSMDILFNKKINNIVSTKKRNGFTIVETLVAITILMIAIAGPMTIAFKSLKTALYAKDQMTASYLAQEAMELIRSDKDNAIANNGSSGFTTLFGNGAGGIGGCTIGSSCWIAINNASKLQYNISSCSGEACRLYSTNSDLNGIGYGLSGGSATASQFSRYFYVSSIAGNANEYTVTVRVDWNQGTVSNNVIIDAEMTNTSL